MSSDIMSRPVDVKKYGLIYGGAQKNVGPAGVTFVIVKKSILGNIGDRAYMNPLPTMVDYRTHAAEEAKNISMFNTPPVLPIFMMHETLVWLKDTIGGVEAMNKINTKKSNMLYEEIDRNSMFVGTAEKEDRSIMNHCWVMAPGYESRVTAASVVSALASTTPARLRPSKPSSSACKTLRKRTSKNGYWPLAPGSWQSPPQASLRARPAIS